MYTTTFIFNFECFFYWLIDFSVIAEFLACEYSRLSFAPATSGSEWEAAVFAGYWILRHLNKIHSFIWWANIYIFDRKAGTRRSFRSKINKSFCFLEGQKHTGILLIFSN